MINHTQQHAQDGTDSLSSTDTLDAVDAINNGENLNTIINRLLATFIGQMREQIVFSGLKFSAKHFKMNFISGVMGKFRCTFELKVGDEHYGDICLANNDSFTDSDISHMESLLAGLLMHMHEVLRTYSVVDEKGKANSTQSRAVQTETAVSRYAQSSAATSSTSNHKLSNGAQLAQHLQVK